MSKITPFLWFDKEADEAAKFYTSFFPDSKIHSPNILDDTPSGTVQVYSLDLSGQPFTFMNAGPEFKINPSISFFINFDPSQMENAEEKLKEMWAKFIEGGQILMPLDQYPFSKLYGWVQDKYGVSWQLILTNPEGEPRPSIIPSLLFTQRNAGRAEEALDLYLSIFKDSKKGLIARYPKGMEPEKEGTIMFSDFMIEGMWLAAMDSARDHKFIFNEAVSFVVNCANQEEVDYYWGKLTANGGEESQCGWLKDKFGISWQIVPRQLNELMGKDKTGKVMQAMLNMKKIEVKKLQEAYDSN